MKSKILCVVGHSASGKSTLADYINKTYNIPIIESWTDRPRRTPNEKGHTFVTQQEFDTFKKEDMIAYTEFGGKRYCCFHSDVKEKNLYVIDPYGLEYLKNNFNELYDIKSMYVFRYSSQRLEDAGIKRFKRDKGKFYLPDSYYDYYVMNTGSLEDTKRSVDEIVKQYFGGIK